MLGIAPADDSFFVFIFSLSRFTYSMNNETLLVALDFQLVCRVSVCTIRSYSVDAEVRVDNIIIFKNKCNRITESDTPCGIECVCLNERERGRKENSFTLD